MIALTLLTDVSSARSIFHSELDVATNRRVYGDDYSPQGLGDNLEIRATFVGEMDPKTNLLVPHEFLQVMLREVALQLDHGCLNETVMFFKERIPTLENVALFVFHQLTDRLTGSGVRLQKIRVSQGERCWVDVLGEAKVYLTQEWTVRCLHQHRNPDLSDNQNRELYGKCAAIHGHEYRVRVTVGGAMDPDTGVVMERGVFERIVKTHLIDPLDGQFLNLKVGNTSGEIIVETFTDRLRPHLQNFCGLAVRETRKNTFYGVDSASQAAFTQALI